MGSTVKAIKDWWRQVNGEQARELKQELLDVEADVEKAEDTIESLREEIKHWQGTLLTSQLMSQKTVRSLRSTISRLRSEHEEQELLAGQLRRDLQKAGKEIAELAAAAKERPEEWKEVFVVDAKPPQYAPRANVVLVTASVKFAMSRALLRALPSVPEIATTARKYGRLIGEAVEREIEKLAMQEPQ